MNNIAFILLSPYGSPGVLSAFLHPCLYIKHRY
jgi:hypothetical protein